MKLRYKTTTLRHHYSPVFYAFAKRHELLSRAPSQRLQRRSNKKKKKKRASECFELTRRDKTSQRRNNFRNNERGDEVTQRRFSFSFFSKASRRVIPADNPAATERVVPKPKLCGQSSRFFTFSFVGSLTAQRVAAMMVSYGDYSL